MIINFKDQFWCVSLAIIHKYQIIDQQFDATFYLIYYIQIAVKYLNTKLKGTINNIEFQQIVRFHFKLNIKTFVYVKTNICCNIKFYIFTVFINRINLAIL